MAQIKTNLQYGTTGTVQSANIADDAITSAKLADDSVVAAAIADNAVVTAAINADAITAAKVADDVINSEHLVDGGIDTAHIADDQITLAKMAAGTDGNVITYDASGNPAVVATGTSGHCLKSQGAGSVPVFAEAGGGKVLQVVGNFNRDSLTTTNTSYTATGHQVAITPSATSSKVLLLWQGQIGISHHSFAVNLAFSGDGGSNFTHTGDGGIYLHRGPTSSLSHDEYWGQSLHFLDSPNSTSALTYELYIKVAGSGTVMFNALGIQCHMTAIEVGA